MFANGKSDHKLLGKHVQASRMTSAICDPGRSFSTTVFEGRCEGYSKNTTDEKEENRKATPLKPERNASYRDVEKEKADSGDKVVYEIEAKPGRNRQARHKELGSRVLGL
jgi:hypothetical protein